MSTISPYIDELQSWKKILKDKTLIFDADAIISISKYSAALLIDNLKKNKVACCYIHPVLMETLNTDNVVERATRQTILDQLAFVKMNDRIFETAKDLQMELHDECKTYPSPTDIYLGACAKWFPDTFLITANLADFPYPPFIRVSGIIVQGNKSLKVLSILEYKDSIKTPTLKEREEKTETIDEEDIPF